MSKPEIDKSMMTLEDIIDLMDELRDELDAREQLIIRARDGRPKGPGRPPKNGVTKLKAADLEPATDGD